MSRIAAGLVAACLSCAVVAGEAAVPELTAEQIVDRYVAARGGADAWHRIETMTWVGHIESAGAPATKIPFVLEMKRPDKSRFEIKAMDQAGVRIFDGSRGWKLRFTRGGMPAMQPFTAEELSYARDGFGIEGPLLDYQAKGVGVALEGTEEVEGQLAYRLGVTLPSGATHHVWIDARSFLEVKYDREARNAFGVSGTVSVMERNYQAIDGVQLPLVTETGGGSARPADRMVIDQVRFNQPMDDQLFAKPNLPGQHHVIAVEADPRPVPRAPFLRSRGAGSAQ